MGIINKYYYSERGIVHSIIEDIDRTIEEEQKKRIYSLLNSIEFVDNNKPFDSIEINTVDFIEEPDFSQFGSPDLIMTINNDIAIFIEAKLSNYKKSAVKIETDNPDCFVGNFSKINIQLALRYRFCEALKNKSALKEKKIIEKLDHLVFYAGDEIPRKLIKDFVVENYVSKIKDCKNFYFVAMTNDKTPLSNKHPMYDGKMRPPLKDRWDKEKQHFGLLRYDSLVENNVVSINDNSLYAFTSKILKDAKFVSANGEGIIVKTKPLNSNDSLLKPFAKLDNCGSFICQRGSLSKLENNVVVAKIFQYDDKVYAGRVKTEDDMDTSCFVVGGKAFICIELDVSSQNPEVIVKQAEKKLLII